MLFLTRKNKTSKDVKQLNKEHLSMRRVKGHSHEHTWIIQNPNDVFSLMET